jgi:hypothetical protein
VAKLNSTGSALVYSTYLGGSGGSIAYAIAVDAAGNASVTGQTYAADFPTTPGAFQTTCHGCVGEPLFSDAFVTRLNPTGSALVYSTFLGGGNNDTGSGIAVDKVGNVYVTGQTFSAEFPTTPGAFQTKCGSCGDISDAFVTKLNVTGSALVYSTFLGGSNYDFGNGIAVNAAGNAYVTGLTYSIDFPTTPSVFQTTCGGGCAGGWYDAFVTQVNPAGSALIYSTYLGGSSGDDGAAIAVDRSGNAYVTGFTKSTDFPTMTPLQSVLRGTNDAFVTKINSSGSALLYSTYLGGSADDFGTGIAVDTYGSAYVTGYTTSTNFPTVKPLQATNGGLSDAFVVKLNPLGSHFAYSTYLGGSGDDHGYGIAQHAGNAYVIGMTASTNFPTKAPLQRANGGHPDAFVSKISRPSP